MNSNGNDFILTDYAQTLIRIKAHQLCRRPEFGKSDQDDLQQELWMMVCEQVDKYDPSKSSVNTFINLLVNDAAAQIVRKHSRLKRGNGKQIVSLRDCGTRTRSTIWDRAVSCVHLFRRIGHYPSDPTTAWETAEAVQFVLDQMPDNLREICLRLMDGGTENSVAVEMNISRHAVRNARNAIRAILEEADIENV